MPVTATFGALTFIKFDQESDWRWWGLYASNITGNFVSINKDSNANVYIPGYVGNSTKFSTFVKITDNFANIYQQPNLVYMQQSNTANIPNSFPNSFSLCSTYDLTNDKLIIMDSIRYVTNSVVTDQGLNQVFYPNGTPYTNYIAVYTRDAFTVPNPRRIVTDVAVHANGDYVTVGYARKNYANSVVNEFNFISSYSANGVNKIDKGIYNAIQNAFSGSNSYVAIQNSNVQMSALAFLPNAGPSITSLLELTGNLNSINFKKQICYANGNDITGSPAGLICSNNNTYVAYNYNTFDSTIIKCNPSTNTIHWQKVYNNTTIESLRINTSNNLQIICTGSVKESISNITGSIMSINSNSGNVEWVNKIQVNSINDIPTGISCESSNLYLTGNLYILKVPANGIIPSTGNYTFGNNNVRYSPVGNPAYADNSLIFATANITNPTENTLYQIANVSSNLANYFTYDPKQLVS